MPASTVLYEAPPKLQDLILNGVRLWHEEAEIRSRNGIALVCLWEEAEVFMNIEQGKRKFLARQEHIEKNLPASPLKMALLAEEYQPFRASDMLMLVMGGSYVPAFWKSKAAFPYAGLVVSAYYFLEAKNLQAVGDEPSAWASLTQGYYYLGINSSSVTLHEFTSAAAKSKSADYSHDLRAMVVEILETFPQDGTIKSAAKAIDRVARIVESNRSCLAVLLAFDDKTPAGTKIPRNGTIPSTPIDRFRKNLENWSGRNSRYPEVATAFAPFKRRPKD